MGTDHLAVNDIVQIQLLIRFVAQQDSRAGGHSHVLPIRRGEVRRRRGESGRCQLSRVQMRECGDGTLLEPLYDIERLPFGVRRSGEHGEDSEVRAHAESRRAEIESQAKRPTAWTG